MLWLGRVCLQPGYPCTGSTPITLGVSAAYSPRPQGALGAQTRVLQEAHLLGPPPDCSARVLRRAFSWKRSLGQSTPSWRLLSASGRNWALPGVGLSPVTLHDWTDRNPE